MSFTTLTPASKSDFIVQQGLHGPLPESPDRMYAALQFQPRIVGILVLIGTVTSRPEIFVALGIVQWWSVAWPRWNPFDILHNRTRAARRGVSLLPAAPPRLFAQAVAGSLSLSIGVMLALGNVAGALLLESFFLLAVAAVVVGRTCMGAALFHALNRRGLLGGRAFDRVCRIP